MPEERHSWDGLRMHAATHLECRQNAYTKSLGMRTIATKSQAFYPSVRRYKTLNLPGGLGVPGTGFLPFTANHNSQFMSILVLMLIPNHPRPPVHPTFDSRTPPRSPRIARHTGARWLRSCYPKPAGPVQLTGPPIEHRMVRTADEVNEPLANDEENRTVHNEQLSTEDGIRIIMHYTK